MARPARNNVDYFPFYCKEGRAMFYIEEKYGNDGYSAWIKILRQLAVTNFHYLNLSDEVDAMYLAAKCKVSEEKLNNIITDLAKLKEFNLDLWNEARVVYSEKFIESIEDAYSKRNNNLLNLSGLREHLLGLGILKPIKCKSKGGRNTQSILEYSKEDNTKEEDTKELFELFWNLYDKKTSPKEKTLKKFKTLKEEEINLIFDHVPKYVNATPEKKYRKDPLTYLNQKAYENEIIGTAGGNAAKNYQNKTTAYNSNNTHFEDEL